MADGTIDLLQAQQGQVALRMHEREAFPAIHMLCMQLATSAVSAPATTEGFLTFQGDESLFGSNASTWLRRFAVFDGAALRFWQYPEHVASRPAEVGVSVLPEPMCHAMRAGGDPHERHCR